MFSRFFCNVANKKHQKTQAGYGVLVGTPNNRALTLRYATKARQEKRGGLGTSGDIWGLGVTHRKKA